MSARCDGCGRFARRLHDVWVTAPEPSIDRAVCDRCAHALGVGNGGKGER